MPSLSSIVSVLVSLVLVAGSTLPCPCGPEAPDESGASSCCAGMAVDDSGHPVADATDDDHGAPHDAAECPHCQPDETTLTPAGAHVAPSAVLVLAFDAVTQVHVRPTLREEPVAGEPRAPPDATEGAGSQRPSNRDLLALIEVLRC